MQVSYWELPATAPLPSPTRVRDVVVIGGGFAGLSTARALLEAAPGIDLALLESERVGYGASGRNAGMVLPFPPVPAWMIDGALPRDDARWATRELHARIETLVGDLGSLAARAELVMITRSRLGTRAFRWLARNAEEHELAARVLVGSEVEERSAQAGRAGVSFPAYRVEPWQLAQQLARRVCDQGGVIHEGVRVSRLLSSDARTSAGVDVITERGALRARRVVVCTNAYTPSLGLGAQRARVVHSYMLATERLDQDMVARLGGLDTLVGNLDFDFTFRRIHDERLLFGGLDIAGLPPNEESARHDVARARLRRLLRGALPWLSPVDVAFEWGGAFYSTSTDVPVIRPHAQLPGVVLNLGYGGGGVALSLASGSLVRGLVVPETDTPDDARLRDAFARTRIPFTGLCRTAVSLLAS